MPDMKSKLFLTDDPALVVLYAQLRDKTLQTLRGASKVTPRIEWEFVLHSAKLYDRMGCDLLGLDLGVFPPASFVTGCPLTGVLLTLVSPKLGVPANRSRTTWTRWRCRSPQASETTQLSCGGRSSHVQHSCGCEVCCCS